MEVLKEAVDVPSASHDAVEMGQVDDRMQVDEKSPVDKSEMLVGNTEPQVDVASKPEIQDEMTVGNSAPAAVENIDKDIGNQVLPASDLRQEETKTIVLQDGAKYKGESVTLPNGVTLPQGWGKLEYPKKNRGKKPIWCAGLFKDGELNGYGVAVFKEKVEWYEGEFVNGVMQGNGTFRHRSGMTTSGEFENNVVHGYGQREFPNGDKFCGEFRNGLSCGQGVYKFENGDVYEGQFSNDGANGFGIKQFTGGVRYTGTFKGDKMNGKGVLQFPMGDVYKGWFLDDMMHGRGIYQFENGDWCSGEFENDRMNGVGEFFFMNGDKYVGSFKNDEMHGTGTFIWTKKGEKYDGEFRKGKMQPEGCKTFADGSTFTGPFSNGKPNGAGIYTFPKDSPDYGKLLDVVYEQGTLKSKGKKPVMQPDLTTLKKEQEAATTSSPVPTLSPTPSDNANTQDAVKVPAQALSSVPLENTSTQQESTVLPTGPVTQAHPDSTETTSAPLDPAEQPETLPACPPLPKESPTATAPAPLTSCDSINTQESTTSPSFPVSSNNVAGVKEDERTETQPSFLDPSVNGLTDVSTSKESSQVSTQPEEQMAVDATQNCNTPAKIDDVDRMEVDN
uniref:MORN repeat protein n=1 Tax=Mucochytrium quahogii TaxID=96639 RepID=A0A7S2RYY8_9STRA|mmetsp:Transcript_3452/g.4985  ORF Transcript_3452/g.4985 Transcript_3452/m.4985 type:complete len:617 (+) Transcript_3452:34-1884(+)